MLYTVGMLYKIVVKSYVKKYYKTCVIFEVVERRVALYEVVYNVCIVVRSCVLLCIVVYCCVLLCKIL